MDISSIVPISSVHLLRGVPLNNGYKNSLTFADTTAQYNYFFSKVKSGYSFQDLTPVKLQNAIQLPCCSDDIYDCNYLMFKNANFTSKWLYAFITQIEFIGINCCKVYFEIDVLQTWKFDYTLKDSFVVREHVTSDFVGEHLVPESLETGDYACNSVEEFDFSPQSVCILSSLTSDLQPAVGDTINGVYSGLNVVAGIPVTTPASINAILDLYIDAGKEDSIVAMYQYPTWCGGASATTPKFEERTITSNLTTLNGYTPKNRKLFTSPYNFIIMSNNEGKSANFKYEDFLPVDSIQFGIVGVYLTSPCIFVYPNNHRGIAKDYDSGLTLSNFPQCAWTGDSFKAWISQNKGALALSGIASVSTIAGGVITANPFAVGSGVMSIAGQVGSVYDHTQVPPQMHGQISADSINAGMNRIKFSFYKMSIKYNYAKIIDDYFTKFGYKVNSLKTPNVNSRKAFNYIQTIDCNIVGNVPFNDIDKISKIFDSGITWWHGDFVGDYSRDNTL